MKRAQVILASAQRFTVQRIAQFSGMSDGYIRILIHAFNEEGWPCSSLDGTPGTALSSPKRPELGLPFGQWSLRRLRDTAVARGVVESISLEWYRVICDEEDVTHQSIRTWKESKDPRLEEKRRRIETGPTSGTPGIEDPLRSGGPANRSGPARRPPTSSNRRHPRG